MAHSHRGVQIQLLDHISTVSSLLQSLLHNRCVCKTGIRAVSAGLHDHRGSLGRSLGRRCHIVTPQAAIHRFLPGIGIEQLLFIFNEGQAVVVQQTVQHDTQRIQICTGIVISAGSHFRCHIVVCTLLGQTAGGVFQGTGNAEVAQFEISQVIDKNVLRLNIPVDHIFATAQLQSRADIHTQLQNLCLGHSLAADIGVKGGQQLHTDDDVPSDLTGTLHHLIVLNADDVLRTLQAIHQLDLLHKVIHDTLEVGSGLFLSTELGTNRIHLRLIQGYGDHLDGRFTVQHTVRAYCSVYRTVRALTQDFLYLPVRPYLFNHFRRHKCTSFIFS